MAVMIRVESCTLLLNEILMSDDQCLKHVLTFVTGFDIF